MDKNKTILGIVSIICILFAFMFFMRTVSQYNELVIGRDNAAINKGCMVVNAIIVCK